MIRIEGNQIIMELSEGEAKIAARLMPLLAPMLDFSLKIFTKILFEMVLLGKDKLDDLVKRMEAGEDDVLREALFPDPESFKAFAEKLTEDFPGPEEINKMLGSLDEQ